MSEKLKEIPLDELYDLTFSGSEKDWNDYFSKYSFLFTPHILDINQYSEETKHSWDWEIIDDFILYRNQSINYWNIYCSIAHRSQNLDQRYDELKKYYTRLFTSKEFIQKRDPEAGIKFPNVNTKIELIDETDFYDNLRGAEIDLENFSYAVRHFAEYQIIGLLFFFFDQILTDFIFRISDYKCFYNYAKYENCYDLNNRYQLKDPNIVKTPLKIPLKEDFKTEDEYYVACSKYNEITRKIVNKHHPIQNIKWKKFFHKLDNSSDNLGEYEIKAKFIDDRCGSNLYENLLSDDKYIDFRILRNKVVHNHKVIINHKIPFYFQLVSDLLYYLMNDKKILETYEKNIHEHVKFI